MIISFRNMKFLNSLLQCNIIFWQKVGPGNNILNPISEYPNFFCNHISLSPSISFQQSHTTCIKTIIPNALEKPGILETTWGWVATGLLLEKAVLVSELVLLCSWDCVAWFEVLLRILCCAVEVLPDNKNLSGRGGGRGPVGLFPWFGSGIGGFVRSLNEDGRFRPVLSGVSPCMTYIVTHWHMQRCLSELFYVKVASLQCNFSSTYRR